MSSRLLFSVVAVLVLLAGVSDATSAGVCGPHNRLVGVSKQSNGKNFFHCSCDPGYVPVTTATVWGNPPRSPGCVRARNEAARVPPQQRARGSYQVEPVRDTQAKKSSEQREQEKKRSASIGGTKRGAERQSEPKRQPSTAARDNPPDKPKTTATLGATQPARPPVQQPPANPPVSNRSERLFPEIPSPKISAASWSKGFSDSKAPAALTLDRTGLDRLQKSNERSSKWAGDESADKSKVSELIQGAPIVEFFRSKYASFADTVGKLKSDAIENKKAVIRFVSGSATSEDVDCSASIDTKCADERLKKNQENTEEFGEKQQSRWKKFFRKSSK